MHPALTTATLADLRRPRRYPAISILMPTHRREPDNAQVPVWQNVSIGRTGLLAVEEGFLATVHDDGDHLVPAEPGDPEARDDIVDEIVEKALDTGARVRFVPDGTLSDANRIAAVLRY